MKTLLLESMRDRGTFLAVAYLVDDEIGALIERARSNSHDERIALRQVWLASITGERDLVNVLARAYSDEPGAVDYHMRPDPTLSVVEQCIRLREQREIAEAIDL